DIEDHHGPSDAKHNPPQPLKVSQQTLVSFLTEITRISIDFLTPKRFYTSAGNPVKEILFKLNLPDHRKLKDGGEVCSASFIVNMEDDVDINSLTIEQYLAWVQDDIRPGVIKPKISNDVEFEINSNFMRELRRKLFKGTDDEDAHEHVRRVLEIADLFHFPGVTHDAVMLRVFPVTLKGSALRWINRLPAGVLDSKGFIPLMTPTQALISIQVMTEHSHNWYDEATTREQINDSPNNVDTKKPKENIHAIQAIFKNCEGAHLTMEYPLEKKDKAVE
ncbi:hypothetical protein Tco_1353878, partial [Tanacetum coccineum]